MRPIKFRGRDIDTYELVYGDFVHNVPMSSFNGIIDDNDFVHEINDDTVAQLVGYDKDGREVYEGDTFVVPCGTEIAARFFGNITQNAKLKENQS
ncbi:MAG: hypothetical protein IJ774_08795 [Selenomonadaceae bacterium]|nr:hypothetical protein [Selenomonadaceae bacterium]